MFRPFLTSFCRRIVLAFFRPACHLFERLGFLARLGYRAAASRDWGARGFKPDVGGGGVGGQVPRKALLLFLLAASPSAIAQTPEESADAVVKKAIQGVQNFYGQLQDFSADFEQTFTRVKLQRESKESGRFFFLKPGKMRFQYTKPERKAFLYNGETLWMYNQEEEEVKVQRKVSRNDLGIAFRFLWGSVDLHKDFQITQKKPFPFGKPGDICLELQPRIPQRLFKTLYFAVDPKTYEIRETIYTDQAGNRNHFRFSKIRKNRGLKASLFDFKVPKGVQVIEIR